VAKRADDYGEPIKLLHANVQISNDNPVRFIQLVQAQQPDIIVIQEATPRWLASLGEISSSYPHKLTESRDDPFGIALYSRFPLDKTIIVASEPRGYPEIIARAIVGGKRLNIISTHPVPPIGVANFGARNIELDAVAKLAARTPRPVIVVGDLNITIGQRYPLDDIVTAHKDLEARKTTGSSTRTSPSGKRAGRRPMDGG